MSTIRPRATLAALALLLTLLAPACGAGLGGESGHSSTAERTAVARAAAAYIEESSRDEDDAEKGSALKLAGVRVQGDSAEVRATSPATGNRYEVTLARSGGEWQGRTLLTDRPEPEEPSAGRSPASGPGRKVSTAMVEATIEKKLLAPLGLKGGVSCPPKIAVRRGNDFECKLTGRRSGTITVTQKDDKGNLNFKVQLKAG